MGLHLFFSALFGDGNMGSIGKHEISLPLARQAHSAKAPLEMKAIHNRWGIGMNTFSSALNNQKSDMFVTRLSG